MIKEVCKVPTLWLKVLFDGEKGICGVDAGLCVMGSGIYVR